MKQIFAVFGILTVGAVGQPPTTIGGHQVGETVQQFVDVTHGADYASKLCRSHKRDDRLQCRGLMDLVNGQPGVLQTKDESRDYRWRFVNGKLYELNIMQRGSLNTEREIGLLVEKYGPPSERRTVVLQNAYGAKWECPEVSWSMPDGTFIQAGEYIDADYHGAPRRRILITFMSKEAIADVQRKGQPKSNPYGTPK
jgi:hypothetical protein